MGDIHHLRFYSADCTVEYAYCDYGEYVQQGEEARREDYVERILFDDSWQWLQFYTEQGERVLKLQILDHSQAWEFGDESILKPGVEAGLGE